MIYVVQNGDTLYTIARRFNVSLTEVLTFNALIHPEQLIVGQALWIPGPPSTTLQYTLITGDTLFKLSQTFNTTVRAITQENSINNPNIVRTGLTIAIPGWMQIAYIIRPEDTLYSIAGRFNSPLNLLIRVNQLSNPGLIFPGQIIRIPLRPAALTRKPSTTIGYFQLTDRERDVTSLSHSLAVIAPYITYGAIFQFPISPRGSIVIPNSTERVIRIMKDAGVAPLMVLTNWGAGGFDSELARTVLNNESLKSNVINELSGLLKRMGLAGVNIDFENMFPEDRPIYNDFIRDLVNTLRPQGLKVVVTIAPKFSDLPSAPWVGAFDYATLGELADLIFIMTYEWGWIGGAPLAVAPIQMVNRALKFALSQIPAQKIIQGVPFYGYNWPLPDTPENLAVPVNLVEVYDLAYRFHAVIRYDPVSEAPWFRYTDERNQQHEVWFEDARSVEVKYLLSKSLGLKGVGWWSYVNEPYGFPQNWPVLSGIVQVSKLSIGG
jgi:spore germination protein